MVLSNSRLEKLDNEDLILLRLYCWNCDAIECPYAKKTASINTLYGCNKWVSEETAAQYIHYLDEVIPYWKQYPLEWVNNSYFEIYDFLQNQIYNQPTASLLNDKGEAIKNEKIQLL